jgi:hypothetical protein
MAKEEKEKPAESKKTEQKAGKKKKLHLHEIRSTQAADGSIVHHHTFKEHKDAHFTMPERGPMATSASPEEAGQHVAEQFGMNQGGGGEEPEGGEPEGGGEPQAGGGGMQPGA